MTIRENVWKDREYCQRYFVKLDLSRNEVHYGWLAPGEKTLKLIDISLKDARVLDIGCGGGENLISLSKTGANCYGIDISPIMLDVAEENFKKEFKNKDYNIHIAEERMQVLLAFEGVSFDLVISIYSMEFVGSLAEFREVLYRVYDRLKLGGLFVFCFSHPMQHYAFQRIINTTESSSDSEDSPVIYSFRDVVRCVCEVGFSLERIIEQVTLNPSKLTVSQQQGFPYHFKPDLNPCLEKFDAISNSGPHTVIYKLRKPSTTSDTGIFNSELSLTPFDNKIRLWGRDIEIIEKIPYLTFEAFRINPWDGIIAVSRVLEFHVSDDDIQFRMNITLKIHHRMDVVAPSNSLLGITSFKLSEAGFAGEFSEKMVKFPELGNVKKNSLFLERIPKLDSELRRKFPKRNLGILLFVNGREPNRATSSGEQIVPKTGDKIVILYVVTDENYVEREVVEPIQLKIF